jgi:hypothetical protein
MLHETGYFCNGTRISDTFVIVTEATFVSEDINIIIVAHFISLCGAGIELYGNGSPFQSRHS